MGELFVSFSNWILFDLAYDATGHEELFSSLDRMIYTLLWLRHKAEYGGSGFLLFLFRKHLSTTYEYISISYFYILPSQT